MNSKKLPHVSELNKITNSTFDFSEAEWDCALIQGQYQLQVICGQYSAIDAIPANIWAVLTPAGKRITFEATIATMALSLVSNWRNSNE